MTCISQSEAEFGATNPRWRPSFHISPQPGRTLTLTLQFRENPSTNGTKGHQEHRMTSSNLGKTPNFRGSPGTNWHQRNKAGLGFFRKKPISSRTPGRNWKKLEESGFFHFIPEESGRNWNKVKDTTRINV